MIRLCTAQIRGESPYSPSRYIDPTRLPGETGAAREARVWRQKAHATPAGQVMIPLMAFRKALDAAAGLTPRKVEGRGKQTYRAQIKSGVMMTEPLVLPLSIDDMRCETFLCSVDGNSKGIGGKVPKTFPMIDEWGGALLFYLTNDTIGQNIFETYLKEAGLFIGVGRFRPETGGINGRFTVSSFQWSEQ